LCWFCTYFYLIHLNPTCIPNEKSGRFKITWTSKCVSGSTPFFPTAGFYLFEFTYCREKCVHQAHAPLEKNQGFKAGQKWCRLVNYN